MTCLLPPAYWLLDTVARMVLGFRPVGTWRSLASAPEWGSGGRRFKSSRPDHLDIRTAALVQHERLFCLILQWEVRRSCSSLT